MNTFINKILPAHDISTASTIDYWATQKNFYFKVMGIAEDYVIANFTLLELGIKKRSYILQLLI